MSDYIFSKYNERQREEMTAIIQTDAVFVRNWLSAATGIKDWLSLFHHNNLINNTPHEKTSSAFLFAAFIAITSSAQKLDNLVELKQKSENPLFHHLDKAPRTPAFECEGYWAWGSSVVKGDDGKYHMFVSRFPKSLPFHPG